MRNLFLLRAFIATLVGLCSALAWPGPNAWTSYGLPGGKPRDLVVAPSDDIYAAYGHGVYQRRHSNDAYSLMHSFAGEPADIAYDPTRYGSIYIAVPGEGLFRSHDDGRDLLSLAPAGPIRTVATSADGMTVYYATDTGSVFRSTDAGVSFAARTSVGRAVTSIVVDSANPDLIYAAAIPFVARSSDGGATWTQAQVSVSISTINELVKLPGSNLVLAGSNGVYQSGDNGDTWTNTLAGSFFGVTAAPSAPGTVISGEVVTGQLYSSPDSGVTWSPLGVAVRGAPRLVRFTYRAAPPPQWQIFVADQQGIQISEDLAATWADMRGTPSATFRPVQLAATTVPHRATYAYVGEDGDGLFTTASGEWERIDLSDAHALVGVRQFGSASLALRPDDPQSIYLGTATRGMFRTSDGGANWLGPAAGTIGIGTSAFAFDPVDLDIMYAVVFSGLSTPTAGLYRSVDGGMNWSAHSNGSLPNLQLARRLVIDPANPARMFIAVGEGQVFDNLHGLYRSIDGGMSWTRVAFANVVVRDIVIDPSDSNHVYAATGDGLAISTDGGTSFTINTQFAAIAGIASVGAIAIDSAVPSTWYAASYDFAGVFNPPAQRSSVLRSVDRGATWEVLQRRPPRPVYAVSEDFVVSDLLLYPGSATILASTDGHGVVAFDVTTDISLSIVERGVQGIDSKASSAVEVSNLGPFAATGLRLTQTLPAAATNISATIAGGSCNVAGATITCSLPALLPSAKTAVEMSYAIPASYPTASAFQVTSSVSMQENDSNPVDNSITNQLVAWQVVDLGVELTATTQSVDRNQTFEYTLQVRNEGPSTAAAPDVLFQPGEGMKPGALPPECHVGSHNHIGCTLAPLAAGATQSLSFTATAIEPGEQSPSALVNAVTTQRDVKSENNSDSINLYSRPVGDLAVSIVELADPVPAGAPLEYRLTVQNLGPERMADVAVTLTGLPGVVIFSNLSNAGCSADGNTVRCDYLESAGEVSFTVTTSLAGGGAITLRAAATSTGADTVASNNSAEETTTVTAPPSRKGGGGSVDYRLLLAGLLLATARYRVLSGSKRRRPLAKAGAFTNSSRN